MAIKKKRNESGEMVYVNDQTGETVNSVDQVPPDASDLGVVEGEKITQPYDPFTDMLGGVKPVEDEMGKVPQDIQAVLDENGLGGEDGRHYRCMLKDITGEGDTSKAAYIDSWKDFVPDYNWVAQRFGPGDYLFVFTWNTLIDDPDAPATTKKKMTSKAVRFSISERYRDLYEDFLIKRMEERAGKKREVIRNAKLKAALERGIDSSFDEPGEPKVSEDEAGLRYIEKVSKVNAMLNIGNAPARSGIDWAEILKAAAPFAVPLIGMMMDRGKHGAESSMQMMKTIIEMQQRNSDQTIALLSKNSGPTTGTEMMKEVMGMVMGAIDIKSALNDKEESVADKIFTTVQGILPVILAMSANKQANAPQAVMARTYLKNDPTMSQLANPAIRAEVVHKFDSTIGWEQTDALLAIAEMDRPEECPRDPSQRYPQGHSANGAEQGDAEVVED